MPKARYYSQCSLLPFVFVALLPAAWNGHPKETLDTQPHKTVHFHPSADYPTSVDLSPDGRRCAALKRIADRTCNDVHLTLTDTVTGDAIQYDESLAGAFHEPWDVRTPWFSPDGLFAAIVVYPPSGGTEIVVLMAEDGSVYRRITLDQQEYIAAIGLSDAQHHLLAAERLSGRTEPSKHILFWDLSTGEFLRTFPIAPGSSSFVLSPDGTCFMTRDARVGPVGDYKARLRDSLTGRILFELPGHSAPPSVMVFSRDGTRCATMDPEGRARIWDTSTGACVAVFGEHAREGQTVTSAAISLDNRFLVAGYTRYIQKVRRADSAPLVVRAVWRGWKRYISFLVDGRVPNSKEWLAKTTAVLWDAKSGARLRSFGWHRGVRSAGFHSDGNHVITIDYENAIRWWDIRDV